MKKVFMLTIFILLIFSNLLMAGDWKEYEYRAIITEQNGDGTIEAIVALGDRITKVETIRLSVPYKRDKDVLSLKSGQEIIVVFKSKDLGDYWLRGYRNFVIGSLKK